MTFLTRLRYIASEVAVRRHERNDLSQILAGPDTALRSELIEIMASQDGGRLR